MKTRAAKTGRARTVRIATEQESIVAPEVRVAASYLARCIGLLGRAPAAIDAGMLFRPGGSIHTLFMRAAVDVAFLDRDYRVLKVSTSVPPWRLALAPRRTRYTLELGSGRLAGVVVGQRLEVAAQAR